jgi:serine/threonine-protein kinase RsbW
MPSPLRLCVRRSVVPGLGGPVTLVTLRFPSDVSYVEEAIELVTRHCLAGFEVERQVPFRLKVVLAEALTNAVLRGNREDRAKSVHVRAELRSETIEIHVSDEGAGFDPLSVPEPTIPGRLDQAGGRGLYIIRKLVDHVHFNAQGNSICMTLRRR